MSIQTSGAASITSLFDVVSTTAVSISTSVESLGHLAKAANTKARFFSSRVETNAELNDAQHRASDRENALLNIATHRRDLMRKLESDPVLRDLYITAKAELDAADAAKAKA